LAAIDQRGLAQTPLLGEAVSRLAKLPFSAGGAYIPAVFAGMYATEGRHNTQVSKLTHYTALIICNI
jgi:hypothetical protein